jgi:hypothetical protein
LAAEAAVAPRISPDELLFRWNNLPRDSHVALYMPDIDLNSLLELVGARSGAPTVARLDDDTLRLAVGDACWLPLPGGRATNIPGLLTVQLPPDVRRGQQFTITVHQITSHRGARRVIGSFQLTIAVNTAAQLLPTETRTLSVLRHISNAIPAADRWHAVFERYLQQIADRVRGFGGDPDAVGPSPTGEPNGGVPEGEPKSFTGKISRLRYDCFGDFEGFVLDLCPGTRTFRCTEERLAELITQACTTRRKITVVVDPHEPARPHQIIVHCT